MNIRTLLVGITNVVWSGVALIFIIIAGVFLYKGIPGALAKLFFHSGNAVVISDCR